MAATRHKGFTLAELLLALVILGIIATFTIPKVLSSQQDSKRKSIFRETISTLTAVVYSGSQTGSLTETTWTSAPQFINHVKACNTDAYAEGCWGGSSAGEATKPGFIMHNGASVCGLDNNPNGTHEEWFNVDWNGPTQGPNTEGVDQINLIIYFPGNNNKKPGFLETQTGTSQTLYEDIFKDS